METIKGCLLVPSAQNPDTGLWFIFHHESDGVLAFDITKLHPEIPYRYFEPALIGEDRKNASDKIVLYGGPEQDQSAMLVLHNNPAANKDSHIINKDFSFLSYRFTLVPGHPPAFTRGDESPAQLEFTGTTDFIVVLGFRIWSMNMLEQDLIHWRWSLLPATQEIVFHTPAHERLAKARRSIN